MTPTRPKHAAFHSADPWDSFAPTFLELAQRASLLAGFVRDRADLFPTFEEWRRREAVHRSYVEWFGRTRFVLLVTLNLPRSGRSAPSMSSAIRRATNLVDLAARRAFPALTKSQRKRSGLFAVVVAEQNAEHGGHVHALVGGTTRSKRLARLVTEAGYQLFGNKRAVHVIRLDDAGTRRRCLAYAAKWLGTEAASFSLYNQHRLHGSTAGERAHSVCLDP